MEWKAIESQEDLDNLVLKSSGAPQLIFKHSSRCSISSMALNRLRSGLEVTDIHIIDVISNRNLSNEIAEKFNVFHQSPQILLIYNQSCIFDASHLKISSSSINHEIKIIG